MPVTGNYLDYILDLLQETGPVEARRMFGGAGLYMNGLFFALIADDLLYFKVDESNLEDYKLAGMEPFRPFGTYSMSYYQVPPGVMEDAAELRAWVQKSLRAAAKQGAKKKKRAKKV